MTALTVIDPGPQTTVQDAGRFGFQALGVPVSGTLDPDARVIANALVGNDGGAAVLEARLVGPTLRADGGPIRIALAGATAAITITRASGRVDALGAWRAVDLDEGDTVAVGPLRGSVTGTLAVSGGVDVAPIFGSRSTLLRAALGGCGGRALLAGDRIPVGATSPSQPPRAVATPPPLDQDVTLRVVYGPQDDHFSQAALATLVGEPYRVGQEADRMGVRLDGSPLAHSLSDNIVSDAIATGALQVPGSGQPILLLADHQTTGGYPKIACVISADLSLAGRLGPGGRVRFAAVGVEEAEAIAREHAAWLSETIEAFVPAGQTAPADPSVLLASNLVSGVTDGID